MFAMKMELQFKFNNLDYLPIELNAILYRDREQNAKMMKLSKRPPSKLHRELDSLH